jgi:hypothetical protein
MRAQSSRPSTVPADVRLRAEAFIQEWTAGARARIEAFTEEQFSWESTLRLRRTALAQDLWITPLNTLLAMPGLALRKTATFLERNGWAVAAQAIASFPLRVRTGHQREVEKRIWREIFGGEREELERKLGERMGRELRGIGLERKLVEALRAETEDFFARREYAMDLIGAGVTWTAAYLLYRDSSLGIWEIGRKIAAAIARKRAVSDFFLGEAIGSVFYNIAPAHPTRGEILLASAVTFVALSALTVLVSYACDPVQRSVGIQGRQLHRALEAAQARLLLELAGQRPPHRNAG